MWEAQCEAEAAIEAWRGGHRGGEEEELAPLRLAHARLLSLRGKPAEAEEALRSLVKDRPADERAAAYLRGLRAGLHARARGNSCYCEGDYEGAAAAYSEGLDVDTGGLLRGLLLANRAQARLQAGRPGEALADADAALCVEPDSIKLHLRRAACALALSRPELARACFERALELEPDCAAAAAGLEQCAREPAGRARRAEGQAAAAAAEEEAMDPYAVLELERGANAAQIRQAFRKAALRWHPDKFAARHGVGDAQREEAERRFRELNAAHGVLTDPVKKRHYDLGGGMRCD
mmetsp:Transcript_28005/g.83401  ORF Transcript_28005/g.83401 Transcript_28005/m.83401 type:complete len:293 (+) Transcript_28005:1305-2183(+)